MWQLGNSVFACQFALVASLFGGPSDLIVRWSIRSICFVIYQSVCLSDLLVWWSIRSTCLVIYQICLLEGLSDLFVWCSIRSTFLMLHQIYLFGGILDMLVGCSFRSACQVQSIRSICLVLYQIYLFGGLQIYLIGVLSNLLIWCLFQICACFFLLIHHFTCLLNYLFR